MNAANRVALNTAVLCHCMLYSIGVIPYFLILLLNALAAIYYRVVHLFAAIIAVVLGFLQMDSFKKNSRGFYQAIAIKYTVLLLIYSFSTRLLVKMYFVFSDKTNSYVFK